MMPFKLIANKSVSPIARSDKNESNEKQNKGV